MNPSNKLETCDIGHPMVAYHISENCPVCAMSDTWQSITVKQEQEMEILKIRLENKEEYIKVQDETITNLTLKVEGM